MHTSSAGTRGSLSLSGLGIRDWGAGIAALAACCAPSLTLAATLCAAVLGLATLGGCAATKAVDTTAAIQAVTAGESHVTYSVLAGDVLDDPQFAGKSLLIPTVPGKDVSFKLYYPSGQVRAELTTQRSHVVDTLLAGAAGIDAEKFAADERLRAWVSQERAAWVELFREQMAARSAAGPAEASNPNLKQQFAAEFLELLRQETGRRPAPQIPPAPQSNPAGATGP